MRLIGKRIRLSRAKRVFALVFVCLLTVTMLGIYVLGSRLISDRRAFYAESLQRQSEKVLNCFSQNLANNRNTAMSIFSAQWYQHYRNVADVYAEEFNALKKIEIANSVQSQVASMSFTEDILIITPAKDSIIRRSGWYSLEQHRFIYPYIEIDTSAGHKEPARVVSNDEDFYILTFNDSTVRYNKSVVCILLDKKRFLNSLRGMMPENCVSANAALDGDTLAVIGTPDGLTQVALLDETFSLTLGYPRFEDAELPTILALVGLGVIALLFLDTAVSLLAMRIITRPMTKMVLQAGGEKRDLDYPFQFLQNYLDTLVSRQGSLSEENRSLQRSRSRFLSMMHNEIYFAMLVNPDFNFKDEYIRSAIPEIAEGKTCVIAMLSPKYTLIAQESLPLEKDFEAIGPCKAIKIYQERYVFLFCTPQQASSAMHAASEKLSAYQAMFYTAIVCAGAPGEYHDAYLQLRRSIDRQRRLWQEIPVSEENAIVNLLRANHNEKCCEYLRTLRGQCSPDAFIRLFTRMSEELFCDITEQIDRYHHAVQVMDADAQWNTIMECVQVLSVGIKAAQRKASANPSGESICRFIRDHFADPELSIVLLAERFQMHRTQVSKIIKQETGITFTELVQQLRLDAAVELLREGSMSAIAVAEQVGYANYATFKRAFARTYKNTPREFTQMEADMVDA